MLRGPTQAKGDPAGQAGLAPSLPPVSHAAPLPFPVGVSPYVTQLWALLCPLPLLQVPALTTE